MLLRVQWPLVVPLVVLPPVAGWLVGWLIGASQTPVVAAAVPLLFGIFGAIGYGTIAKRMEAGEFLDQLVSSTTMKQLGDDARRAIESDVSIRRATEGSAAIWYTLGIVLFCVTCYWGVQRGIAQRVPHYKPLNSFLGSANTTSDEVALFYRLRDTLRASNKSADEYDAILREVFAPVLKRPDRTPGNDQLLQRLFKRFGVSVDDSVPAPAVQAEPAPAPRA